MLSLLVDITLSESRFDEATSAVDKLENCAALHASPYLLGVAALARGRLSLATASGDPQACLRVALAEFARAQMPMEVAHSRLELANALLTERPEVAMAEARAALDAYDRLQAARHADAAGAVLRSLGLRAPAAKRGGGVLTNRETEVLDLIGHGLSNPDISERLFISRKTVEHHVGNILAKLGLRTRGEAAAYSTRSKQGDQ